MSTELAPRYSIVIPTFRRPDMLAGCLESLCALKYPLSAIEVIVVDNGGQAEHSGDVGRSFSDRLRISYLVNRVNQGYGYSVNRGLALARGEVMVILNDDARPSPDSFRLCDALLASDASIGCAGFRAIEAGYAHIGEGLGTLTSQGEVIANFDVDCGSPVEVEHVYGFCYAFTRAALEQAGLNDRTLLAKPYSSGNRIETDHCLSIRRRGFRVVYHPSMTAVHLAKPRPDMSEVSRKWKINGTRNTLYLFLKHFGLFGRGGAALYLTFIDDVGIASLVRSPTMKNASYFLTGLRARGSAYAHWLSYRFGPDRDRPDDHRERLGLNESSPLW